MNTPSPPYVLVVEDEPLILDLVAEELSSAGCRVTAAGSAEEALVLIRACAGDLDALVVDVDLGSAELTGFELAAKARRLNPALAVLYATGRPSEDVAERAVAGAALVAKPYSAAALSRKVGELVGRKPSTSAFTEAA